MKPIATAILLSILGLASIAHADQVTVTGTVIGPDDEAIEGASVAVEYWEGHRITAGRRATPSL